MWLSLLKSRHKGRRMNPAQAGCPSSTGHNEQDTWIEFSTILSTCKQSNFFTERKQWPRRHKTRELRLSNNVNK